MIRPPVHAYHLSLAVILLPDFCIENGFGKTLFLRLFLSRGRRGLMLVPFCPSRVGKKFRFGSFVEAFDLFYPRG